MFKLSVIFLISIASALAVDDGKYRPDKYGGDDGRYRPELYGNDGRYYTEGGAYKQFISPYTTIYNPLATNQIRTFAKPIVNFGRTIYQPYVHNPYASPYITEVIQPNVVQAKAYNPYVAEVIQPTAAHTKVAQPVVDHQSVVVKSFVSKPVVDQPVVIKSYAANPEGSSRILRLENEHSPLAYRYAFDTENNIKVEESGHLENINSDHEAIKATGFYEYVGPDNVKYRVDYIADENGFRPVGDHLPQPHPSIARYLATLK